MPQGFEPVNALSREQLCEFDRRAVVEFGVPILVLMENAGRAAAQRLLERLTAPSRVLVICGPGHNGGDGAVLARHCDAAGHAVDVLWVPDRLNLAPSTQVHRKILEQSGIECTDVGGENEPENRLNRMHEYDWLVDALLGTGVSRPVEGRMRLAVEAMNASGRPIISIDIPSGLDTDTGQPLGTAVCATVTVSFVAAKLAFAQPEAQPYLGTWMVESIGAPRRLLAEFGLNPDPLAGAS
jgi:NAD(P)H-hydrate epimerase